MKNDAQLVVRDMAKCIVDEDDTFKTDRAVLQLIPSPTVNEKRIIKACQVYGVANITVSRYLDTNFKIKLLILKVI
jgi:hypothetical protein